MQGLNHVTHGTSGTTGMAGGTLGGNAPALVPAIPPIHKAMDEMDKEIACLYEEVRMLLGRLGSVCRDLPKGDRVSDARAVDSNCQLEGRIIISKCELAEIRNLVSSARDALCI